MYSIKNFNEDRKNYDALQSKVDNMEPQVKELCSFKTWFYTSIVATLITIVLFVISLILFHHLKLDSLFYQLLFLMMV